VKISGRRLPARGGPGTIANTKDQQLQQLKLVLMGMDGGHPTRMQRGADRSLANMSVTAADVQRRLEGRDWPADGLTMVGMKRLDNVQMCIERVLADRVPGDLVETGVWRGGTAMFMRAVLKAHGVTDRLVFAADSFEGLPVPDPAEYPVDEGSRFHESEYLAVPLETVKENFARYDLLDDQVRFVKGSSATPCRLSPVTRGLSSGSTETCTNPP
jgi:hypothetical protein